LSRPSIFISYSHKDEEWKDRILTHLGIAQKPFVVGDNIARGKSYYGQMLMESGDSERAAKLLQETREGWAAIKYESGVQ
jgi:hypothetical protein